MEYKNMNDYEILYLINDVRDDYARALCEKYEPLIQKKCEKWKSVINKINVDVDDLEQEIRIAFFDAIKSFKESHDTCFYTYFSTIVDFRIKNLVRNMNAKKNIVYTDSISLFSNVSNKELIDFIPFEDASIDKKLEKQELIDAIYRFLYKLPLSKAAVFELYLNQYSVLSISELLNENEQAIRRIIRGCRKNLKDYLQKFDLYVI